jgi:UDP-glucose 4-epimerase
MKVLITGGAGFIGSTLADRLIVRGEDVFIVDNLETGRKENIPKDADFTEGSIACTKVLPGLFERVHPDIVVHAAASYKDPENWYMDSVVNAVGTAMVTKECLKHKVNRLIYFQTSLCYGQHPIEQPITLSHPIKPTNSYAISKTAGEQYIELSGMDFVSFRLANAYGPRNLSGPPPTFYQRLSEGKDCFVVNTRRDFIFVEDLVDIVVKAVDGVGNGFYHVSTGKDYAIKEIYEAVAKAMEIKKPAEERLRGEDDVASILLDPSRTLQDFGMIPKYPLNKGIKKAVEWYKANGVSQTYTHLKGFDEKEE